MAAPMEEVGKAKLTSNSTSSEEPVTKKQKIDNGKGNNANKTLNNFQGFQVSQIISEDAKNKTVFLHGKFEGSDECAVVLLEKTPFREQELGALLSVDTSLTLNLQNDIYSVYVGQPDQKSCTNEIKTTVIYPATDRHIAKYTKQEITLVEETWEDYRRITLPFLEEQTFKIQWVYNILEKTAEEVKRIVCEDPDPHDGFVLLPDMKWDRKQMENLYLVAICHRRGIKSLRDLNQSHLPLLRNIRDKCQQAIMDNYSIPADQLRVYFHYQPSYYHLHVHFTHLKFDAMGSNVTKAHLLSDVIENIELMSDYYQKKTLSFILREKDGLLARFKEKNGEQIASDSN
ncbi:m7GpppX diphosphatase-like [Asterias rubens]|uniref:m7GpppX diphosphatase-like n=1 Tax=Asterias rubens TaxID=7604 RepID=UPI001455D8E0|nr:m7GpppX diphosphatase-like [Asterias rubens]